MKLEDLLAGEKVLACHADPGTEITGISWDTRNLNAGELYFALPGYKTDGQRYAERAAEQGAGAVVCAQAPPCPGPWVVAADPRALLAAVSRRWFGDPGGDMTLVAVAGRSGKTTTASLLRDVLSCTLEGETALVEAAGESCDLQRQLRILRDKGCRRAVIKTSARGIRLGRLAGLTLSAAVMTNFDQAPEERARYEAAMRQLSGQCRRMVVNLDDPAGVRAARWDPERAFTYSEGKNEADLTAKNLRLGMDKVEFEALTHDAIARVSLPIPGGFNVYNGLAALACALVLGVPLARGAEAMGRAKGVPGRMEFIPIPAGFGVIADCAETPAALENVLTTLRRITRRRVLCVFSCRGDRDRSDRPLMGAVASALADWSAATVVEARSEAPADILADIRPGLEEGSAPFLLEADPVRAVEAALERALPGDLVLLAGGEGDPDSGESGQRAMGAKRRIVENYFIHSP